jgi:EmrB/QacA subfamily drug resistance transporter
MATTSHAPVSARHPAWRWTLDATSPYYHWWMAVPLMLGMTAVGLNITAVSLAFPKIMTSLRADLNLAQWVQTGPMIVSSVMMPSVGWLGSLLGNRKLYLLALGVFVCGSMLSGMAWSISSLIVFRLIQGFGMGLLLPLTQVILFQAFPETKRGLAMGVSSLGFSFGPMIGPVVSGYLLEHASWRAVFYLNVPVGLISLILAYLTLPAPESQPRRQLDSVGLVSMATCLVTSLLAITQGREEGWDSPYILSLLGIALVAGVTFVAAELRSAQPFVELRLYKNVSFAMASVVSFLNTIGFMATSFIVALFLQHHLGYTPLQAAWMLMPSAVIIGILSVVTGRLSDFVPPRLLVIFGLGLVAWCLFRFVTINTWTSIGMLTFLLTVRGFARAFTIAPLTTAAMLALPESELRMGAGLLSLVRGVAAASSVALVATWFQDRLILRARLLAQEQSVVSAGREELLQHLIVTFERLGDFKSIASGKAFAMLQNLVDAEAALHSYHDTFIVIGCLSAIAILPALGIGKRAGTIESPEGS